MRPSDSPATCMPDVRLLAFSDRPAPGQRRASPGSPGSRAWSFHPCLGSRPAGLRPVHSRLKLSPTAVWPSVYQDNVGTREVSMISELHTQPACAPVNASPASLRLPAHDSGSGRFATPFLRGSFIHDSKPVYPGAFPESCFFHNPTYYPSLSSAACQETECPRAAGAATARPPLPCSCGKATSAGWRIDSYRQTLCRLSHTFLRTRPFRLSTLDPRLPQEGGEFKIRLARLLPGILSTVLAWPAQRARTPFLGCHNDPSVDPGARLFTTLAVADDRPVPAINRPIL